MTGKTFCFSHDPSAETKRAKLETVTKGGLVRQVVVDTPLQKIEITAPQDVATLLIRIIGEVRDGTIDPKIAGTLGYLTTCLLKAYEISELNGKVEELKTIISDRGLANKRNPYG